MKMYKVLRLTEQNEVVSPFQDFNYGKLEDLIGKEFICSDFDESDLEWSNGFYATNVEGLIYSININKDNRIFEVEMGGKNIRFNEYKHRFERQTIIKLLEKEDVEQLVKEQSNKMDWDYHKAVYPINPFEIECGEVDEYVINLLRQVDNIWNSVNDSVRNSVSDSIRNSVSDSIRNSVWDSVRNSVSDSVWDSVWDSVSDSASDSVWAGLVGTCFPNIKKWSYIEHKEGVYPFQCYVDLFELGFVPSFDGNTWRLHSGEKADIVFEVGKEELRNL